MVKDIVVVIGWGPPEKIPSAINLIKMLLSRWWTPWASLAVDPQNVNV
jgi:hypothetical protein